MSVLLFVMLIGFIFLGVPIGFSILLSSTLFLQITKMKPLVVVAQRMMTAVGADLSQCERRVLIGNRTLRRAFRNGRLRALLSPWSDLPGSDG